MSSNWQHKIQQHEATPPQSAWKNIAGMLDEEKNKSADFVTKLTAFETAPPANTQKNIFALLDAAEHQQFENRLYHYETAVPETAWPQIAAELNRGETKVIPLEPRTRNISSIFLKVAAAIVFIAVLSVTVWLINKPATGKEEIANVTSLPKPFAAPPKADAVASKLPATRTPQQQDVSTAAATNSIKTKNSPSVNNITGPAYVENNDVITLAQNPVAFRADKLQNSDGQTPQDITLLNNSTANAYITIAGPDGQSVRVSSKLAALVSYLNDNNAATQENIEIIIKESAKWRATFASWRDRMTNNSIAPSLTNFMDIIELSNVLEEKK